MVSLWAEFFPMRSDSRIDEPFSSKTLIRTDGTFSSEDASTAFTRLTDSSFNARSRNHISFTKYGFSDYQAA